MNLQEQQTENEMKKQIENENSNKQIRNLHEKINYKKGNEKEVIQTETFNKYILSSQFNTSNNLSYQNKVSLLKPLVTDTEVLVTNLHFNDTKSKLTGNKTTTLGDTSSPFTTILGRNNIL